jgi:signal transduction histidine kinase
VTRVFAGLFVAWALVIGASLAWSLRAVDRAILDHALAEARATLSKDFSYRLWAALHGGVYVSVDASTPPNPYLAHVPERDLTTPSGKQLTLMNPAYMTRQVHEIARERYGYRGHITSLDPIRPENAADPWEAGALRRVAAGAGPGEVTEVSLVDGAPHLRLLQRLVTEAPCLRCHAAQGYKVGDVRGGLSVAVPLAGYLAAARRQKEEIGVAHAGIAVAGFVGLLLAVRAARRRDDEREREERRRQALEAELAQVRKLEAVGQFAGGVAHDLNNFLAPILGNASLALEELPEGHPTREAMVEIRDAAERARRLIQRLLAFGRKQRLSMEVLDPADLVEKLRPLLQGLVGETITLELRGQPGLAVRADRSNLELVLLNLAANARDAMTSGGRLRIEVAAAHLDPATALELRIVAGRHVVFSVSDDGCGMDEPTRKRLFEPFFTTKPLGKGTGLGLATAHGIVRQHGGAICVESDRDQGTTFRIYLPAVEAPAASPAAQPAVAAPAARGRETILVAEDDAGVRRFVAAALSGLGYEVLVAADGLEALRIAAARAGRIDLVLSDLRMPGLGGRELHARLGAERPGIAAVFMSGYADELDQPRSGERVVAKPFTSSELSAAVREVLDAHRAAPAA